MKLCIYTFTSECYEHQSCEHPRWRYSQAYAFCEALLSRLIRELPGYDEEPWGIDGYVTPLGAAA